MIDLINLGAYPVKNVLSRLLQDKITEKNILFAAERCGRYGQGQIKLEPLTESVLLGADPIEIRPRVLKTRSEKTVRTRNQAEVSTPVWMVKQMCDYGEDFRQNSANHWKEYVQLRVLEIACGEAPFLATRYDTTTGEPLPVEQRVGMLDRKLRIISRYAADEKEWLEWALKAYEYTYAYEFQGDSLLIARINLLHTFCDYFTWRFNRPVADRGLQKVAEILAWNVWQMDGLNDAALIGIPNRNENESAFSGKEAIPNPPPCRIYDWQSGRTVLLSEIKHDKACLKFDFVIGNPPYQRKRNGKSKTTLPVYHEFMNMAYALGTVVELITPARFLFNAGRTPKKWNAQMLNDPHLKVLYYEEDGRKVFPNTDIKGGVVVTYRDAGRKGVPIGRFTIYSELNMILSKTAPLSGTGNISAIGFVATKFNISSLIADYPQYAGHERRMSSNVLSFDCFHSVKTSADDVMIYGVIGGKRIRRYIAEKYVDMTDGHIGKFKVIVPKADGAGSFGDIITMPEILEANSGFTHTFFGVGSFDTQTEAEAALKYIKTKFARALLSVLKVTQDMNADKWGMVPLQDFTSQSDIDWSGTVSEIDRQLYTKYQLSAEEIDFVETHVKEME